MPISASRANELAPDAYSMDTLKSLSRQDKYLISAANEGKVDNLRMALNSGANINVRDYRGYTPLMILADIGSSDGVSELINRGADVSVRSVTEGFTAMMIAASSAANNGSDNDVFTCLLKADRSAEHVNCASHSGLTALMICLDAGNHAMSLKLKAANADVNMLNENGLSALTYAATHQQMDTVEFLLKEKFPLSKNQVWQAIDIAAKTNISMCLTLWLAMEKNPESFIGSSEDAIIPELVQRFKNPLASSAQQGVNLNVQDRSINPALALTLTSSPASTALPTADRMGLFESPYFDTYLDYQKVTRRSVDRPLSDDEQSDDDGPPSPVTQRQRTSDGPADLNHPDNRLVRLTSDLFPGPLESVSSQVPLARGGVFTRSLPDPGPDKPA